MYFFRLTESYFLGRRWVDEVRGEAAWPSCLGILHTPLPLHPEPKPVSPHHPDAFSPQILW